MPTIEKPVAFAPVGISAPSSEFAAVVPSDTVGFTFRPRSLYVGTGGNVAAVRDDGTVVSFANVPSGSYLLIRPVRINATGTTAADIVAM